MSKYFLTSCGKAKKAVIEKFKEYKLYVITEAVTKEFKSNVPMKDIGTVWIGEIPKKWKVVSIVMITTVVRCASPRPAGALKYFNRNDVPWITVG